VTLLLDILRAPRAMGELDLARWELLLRQAAAANLSATLASLSEEEGLAARIPPAARRHLDWARTIEGRHRQAVAFEVREIGRALDAVQVPLILLKGAAYVAAGLPAGHGRLFSDIDVLVPKARLPDVESALMLGGWASTHHDAYDQRYYREWMHELPPMVHIRRGNAIDVHHAILPETAPLRPDPGKLCAAAQPVPGLPGVATLAPADMVLHSAVHLFFEGEFDKGLRDLFDLHRLLREFGGRPGFWQALPARARELELARPLFYALRYCRRLLGSAVPQEVLDAVAPAAPNRVLLWLMDQLFARALQPAHPSCDDRFSGLARFALYVRGNWLRMPPLLLSRHLFHKAFLSPRNRTASEAH
jgi:hypothetical protein